MKEFLFDVKLFASIRIRAADEATARKQLAEVLDCADLSVCHGGVDMNDTFEASMDGEADLVEEGEGPYTCTSCLAATWNDDDMCGACADEARRAFDGEPQP